jgi:hypothetical protein
MPSTIDGDPDTDKIQILDFVENSWELWGIIYAILKIKGNIAITMAYPWWEIKTNEGTREPDIMELPKDFLDWLPQITAEKARKLIENPI